MGPGYLLRKFRDDGAISGIVQLVNHEENSND